MNDRKTPDTAAVPTCDHGDASMTTPRKLAAAIIPLVALVACAQGPIIDRTDSSHAQRLAPDVSMLGEACDGHHPTHGVRLRGHSLLLVSARVNEVIGGREVAFAQGAAPADFATSALPRPIFMVRGDGRAACAGVALRTVVRQDRDGPMMLAWDLELGLPGGRIPADAWRVRGETPVRDGSGSTRMGFSADGRDFVAYVSTTQGPAWLAAERIRAGRAAAVHSTPSVGRPLPDEQPGRTLDDVTNSLPASAYR